MRHFFASVALIALMLNPIYASASDVKVVIPEGTLVLTHLLEPMSSAEVHAGDVFQFVVSQDVIVE